MSIPTASFLDVGRSLFSLQHATKEPKSPGLVYTSDSSSYSINTSSTSTSSTTAGRDNDNDNDNDDDEDEDDVDGSEGSGVFVKSDDVKMQVTALAFADSVIATPTIPPLPSPPTRLKHFMPLLVAHREVVPILEASSDSGRGNESNDGDSVSVASSTSSDSMSMSESESESERGSADTAVLVENGGMEKVIKAKLYVTNRGVCVRVRPEATVSTSASPPPIANWQISGALEILARPTAQDEDADAAEDAGEDEAVQTEADMRELEAFLGPEVCRRVGPTRVEITLPAKPSSPVPPPAPAPAPPSVPPVCPHCALTFALTAAFAAAFDGVAAWAEAAAVGMGAVAVQWLRRGGRAIAEVGRRANALLDAAERACLQPTDNKAAPAAAPRARRGGVGAFLLVVAVLAAAWCAQRALPRLSLRGEGGPANAKRQHQQHQQHQQQQQQQQQAELRRQAQRIAELTTEIKQSRDHLTALRASWLASRAEAAARVEALEAALDAAARQGQVDAWQLQQAQAARAQLQAAHDAVAARAARDKAALASVQATREGEYAALLAATKRIAALEKDVAGRDRAAQAAEARGQAQSDRRRAVKEALGALGQARADAAKHPATLPRAKVAEAAKLRALADKAERAVTALVLQQAVRGPLDKPAFVAKDVEAAVRQAKELHACLAAKPLGGWDAASSRRRDRRCLALAAAEPQGMLAQLGLNLEFLLEALFGLDTA